jgi:hypothetical protein
MELESIERDLLQGADALTTRDLPAEGRRRRARLDPLLPQLLQLGPVLLVLPGCGCERESIPQSSCPGTEEGTLKSSYVHMPKFARFCAKRPGAAYKQKGPTFLNTSTAALGSTGLSFLASSACHPKMMVIIGRPP